MAIVGFSVSRWLDRPLLVAAVVAPVVTLGAACQVGIHRRRVLRETEQMRKDFLATVSHELRTPLTPILGFAKFLMRGDIVPPEARRQALTSLLERAEHMQRLVEDLLLASSVDEVGRHAPHARREPVDMSEAVDRAVLSVRASHPHRLVWIDESEPVMAIADALRIRQVLANLLDNAIKFSPPDSVVRVYVGRDGRRAAVSVVDTGRGIPADRVDEIFRKFRRLEDPDHMETGGPGLGLFVVDQLMRAMGGSIEVRSRPGHGSAFTVRLPALAPDGLRQPRHSSIRMLAG
jgi:signal transduction histidine kinase